MLLYVKSNQSGKLFIITTGLFGIGFLGYLYVTGHLLSDIHVKELQILFDRLSLGIILIPFLLFSLFMKRPFILYPSKPRWNNLIYFPYIWSGFHHVKVKTFLLIAITINIVTISPFIILNGVASIHDIFIAAVIFSFSNAILEEFVWRGVLLSRFSEQLGEKWALAITSLGFGLQHYSLGFPWLVCIAFSVGGLFYGVVTIRSQSIWPAIVWHVVLNFLMVFSGWILR